MSAARSSSRSIRRVVPAPEPVVESIEPAVAVITPTPRRQVKKLPVKKVEVVEPTEAAEEVKVTPRRVSAKRVVKPVEPEPVKVEEMLESKSVIRPSASLEKDRREYLTTTMSNIGIDNPAMLERIISNRIWYSAFTHKSADPNENYEAIETVGDKFMGALFVEYLNVKLGVDNPEALTGLGHRYMSKEFQGALSKKIGLDRLAQTGEWIRRDDISLHEDLLEAFFGALSIAGNAITRGLGYALCYNMMQYIMSGVSIDLTFTKDSRTMLKEISDIDATDDLYVTTKEGTLYHVKVYWPPRSELQRGEKQKLIGEATDSKSRATEEAARQALVYLNTIGLNAASAAHRKMEKAARTAGIDPGAFFTKLETMNLREPKLEPQQSMSGFAVVHLIAKDPTGKKIVLGRGRSEASAGSMVDANNHAIMEFMRQ